MQRFIVVVLFLALVVIAASAFFIRQGKRIVAPVLAMSGQARFEYAIYYPKEPAKDALITARELLVDANNPYKWQEAKKGEERGVNLAYVPAAEFKPPTLESLKYFARGMDAADMEAVAGAKYALLFHFMCDLPDDFSYLQSAEAYILRVARETNGFVWDEQARLVYTPAEFQKEVLDNWEGKLPSVRREVVIHLYEDGQLLRGVSLGMEKFGMPNLVVNQVTRSAGDAAATLIMLSGQHMVENWPIRPSELLEVKLDGIHQTDVREWITRSLREGGTRKAAIGLARAKRDEGDAEGPLYELTFAGEKGNTLQERQESLLARIFGAQDSLVHIKPNDALAELSRQARDKLKGVKAHFSGGLLPGERLMVKGPFHAGKDTEYMWIEAVTWEGDVINGILQNDPVYVKTLQTGSKVSIRIEDAYDYIFMHQDGTQEGNETGRLMTEQQNK